MDQMLQRCSDTLGDARFHVQKLKEVAARFNLLLGTYEAGPSIVESSAVLNGRITAGAADK